MKKYFFISDIHGFATQMFTALDEAKFDINNNKHVLVVLGDIFDRGSENKKVLDFIKTIPLDRRVLVRGNHEYLLRDIVKKYYPESHDVHNGTVDTIIEFSGLKLEKDKFGYYIMSPSEWHSACKKVIKSGLIDWIFSNEWVNYFELNNFIGVHCWIPLKNSSIYPLYYVNPDVLSMLDNWKEAPDYIWEESTWGCPWSFIKAGLIIEDKTIICGHWHTSDFYKHLDPENYDGSNKIYKGKNCIAIDGCVALSNNCNILIIDEKGCCYDKNNNII